MKKAIIVTLSAVAMLGVAGCEDRADRDVEVKTDTNRRLGDARPDDGHEGFFENDGVNDNVEPREGTGGSGHVDFDRERDGKVDVDAKVDHDRNKTKVDVDADKEDGKLHINLK